MNRYIPAVGHASIGGQASEPVRFDFSVDAVKERVVTRIASKRLRCRASRNATPAENIEHDVLVDADVRRDNGRALTRHLTTAGGKLLGVGKMVQGHEKPQSSRRSRGSIPSASASLRSVETRGSVISPVSILTIVLMPMPAFSASSPCVRAARRLSSLSFSFSGATVSILAILLIRRLLAIILPQNHQNMFINGELVV